MHIWVFILGLVLFFSDRVDRQSDCVVRVLLWRHDDDRISDNSGRTLCFSFVCSLCWNLNWRFYIYLFQLNITLISVLKQVLSIVIWYCFCSILLIHRQFWLLFCKHTILLGINNLWYFHKYLMYDTSYQAV